MRKKFNAKIIAFPHKGIAYIDSYYEAITALGAKVVEGEWSGRWLLSNIHSSDIVHIHWPSFLYKSKGGGGTILKSFTRFVYLLIIARYRTRHIWWTAHNLMPHTHSRIRHLDLIGRFITIKFSERIFIHGREAEKVFLDKFPIAIKKTVVIPHGNWIDNYPACRSKSQARLNLKLPNISFIYLLFGQCKPYKNLEGLIDAFSNVSRHTDRLLIAGSFSDKSYLSKILKITSGDPRIRVDHGFIPNEKVSEYLLACDCMCMPYHEILTSGTAMLALSYGRPVLSINRGFLRDVISKECGLLINPSDSCGLEEGLVAMRNQKWSEEDIFKVARNYTFSEAASISLSQA